MIHLKRKIVIAIDGFSSCGKSSFAKLLSKELNYIYIDSGAMYRAVALFALRSKLIADKVVAQNDLVERLSDIDIEFKKNPDGIITILNGEDIEQEIRGAAVSDVVSEISKIKEVRTLLVQIQKRMGLEKGIVMDGRDIGTVVFPKAELKIFMKAEVSVRAKRRFDELIEKGIPASLESITKNISERDNLDITREVSPLLQAEDALLLDNSYMTFAEQMEWFITALKNKNLLQ
jgi:cytidylate kinase